MKNNKLQAFRISVILAATLAIGFGATAVKADGTTVKEISNSKQLIREISDDWDDSYAAETVINTATGTVTQNGETVDFADAFETEEEDIPNLHSSYEVKEFFADNPAEVSSVSCSEITVVNSYQTKRIIVNTDTMTEYYGASSVLHYDGINTYFLSYDTEEETKSAYEKLRRRYGSKCMLDEVWSADDMLMDTASYSWGVSYMGMDSLKNNVGVTGISNTATVAIVDTGVNSQHFLFSGSRIAATSYNVANKNYDISDALGHGSHVAGIVAESTPSQVQIMAVKVYRDDNNTCVGLLKAGILYAVENGADVINLSLGDTKYTGGDWLKEEIQMATQKGIPIVCAAGNSKASVYTCYPACDSTTIAVSAIKQNGEFASTFNSDEGSNYGSAIDFAAPGVGIRSASATSNTALSTKTGTSMAAPFVSAAAAYIKLALPNASVAQVKSILENYAVDYGAVGKDDYYGYGVINLADLRLSLSGNATLTLKEAAMTFTGTACTPGILVSGIASGQYTVSYANNTRPGTGTVTITGKGLYTGSLSASFKIQLATPGTPTVANVANGIKVQWKSVAGAGGYVLYRKKGSGAWTRIKSLGSGVTSYTDTGVSAGTTYQYRLQAISGSVISGYSGSAKMVYVKPASLSKVTNSDKGVTLQWKKVSGITGYYIYRKSDSSNTWKCIKTASAKTTSYTDTQAVSGETNTYQVCPYKTVSGTKYKGAGKNNLSTIYMKKMAAVSLSNKSGKKLQVTWQKAAKATGYQIRWSLKKSMASAKTMKITDPSQVKAVISGLKKNKTYYVQIRSLKKVGNTTGYSAWSSAKSVKIRK